MMRIENPTAGNAWSRRSARRRLPALFAILPALVLASACGDDDDDGPDPDPTPEMTPDATPDPTPDPTPDTTPEPGMTQVSLTVTGLEAITEGNYEAWFITGDVKTSAGLFKDPVDATWVVDVPFEGAEQFVITIEPDPDADPEPSGVVVLAGDIANAEADLTFPADLSSAEGGFILRTPTDDATNVSYNLNLAQVGLEDLTEGVYEGWLIYGEEKVSTGRFTTGAGGMMTTDRDPAAADSFVVTIEPEPDADPEPSGVVVLAGDIDGAAAGADIALTFPADLSTTAGGFILRTPTDDATNADNDEAGVWFLEPGDGPTAGLTLPALPDGWVWEGWGVTQGMPLTTGRFTSAEGADLASPYSEGGPPFPGEDFVMDLPAGITPPVDLADGASSIVISVEPDIAGVDPTGDGPFAIKPLALMVPENHPGATFTQLGAGPVLTVTGTLTFEAAPIDNDEAGVWFLRPGDDGPGVGLTLPDLPTGWVWEGWGVTQGMPLTTGRFSSAEGADMASPYSEGGPPYPGEDFLMDLPAGITPPVNLVDGASTIVISVEPDIEGVDPTGDAPFALKPLALPIPEDHATATFTELGAGPVMTVTGSASFSTVSE